jgi:predicted ATP-dependent endonuclease of OLD family
MRIDFVEIANFRKLLAVRVDLAEKTTLLVGANNSGKTSAILALRYFLISGGNSRFCLNDFTLCHWETINDIGEIWKQAKAAGNEADFQIDRWRSIAPYLDLWFKVEDGELHRVSKLIPTLDWAGGSLGIRLRFEPADPEKLWKDFLAVTESIEKLQTAESPAGDPSSSKLPLWPRNLVAFLENKQQLKTHFEIRAYALDPGRIVEPKNGIAKPQTIPPEVEPTDAQNLKALIKIDEINAQRVFGDESDSGDGSKPETSGSRQLSRQLRKYYSEHLDPQKDPDVADLKALEAIELAQATFDQRLAASFKEAID